MKVLFASSEVFPFSKTGGLADVSYSLPLALKRLGVSVDIITPLYKGIAEKYSLKNRDEIFSINIATHTSDARILEGSLKDLRVYFVDCKKYFDRDELYTTKNGDYLDNSERFIFFSRVIVEFAIKNGYDLIHLNDWQTAMAALYAKSIYHFKGKTILTIHNLGYQGLFPHYDMHLTNLSWEYYNPRMLEFWGKINFLKGGIYSADALTTVSPTYAKEILTEEFGFGLDGVLRDVKDRLYGILNGIDYDEWNPQTDRYIVKKYSAKTVAQGKLVCKKDLISHCKLEVDLKTPLIGMISRLANQKGFDILIPAFDKIFEKELSFVILGSGERRYEDALKNLSEKYKGRLACFFEFNNELAHKIEAGTDFFLMPSKYEPCGLNQMISMRYGTIPIVRKSGGLDNTVIDISEKEGYGIKFDAYSEEELIKSISRALEIYKKPRYLCSLRKKCMGLDFSWDVSAKKYFDLYRRVLNG